MTQHVFSPRKHLEQYRPRGGSKLWKTPQKHHADRIPQLQDTQGLPPVCPSGALRAETLVLHRGIRVRMCLGLTCRNLAVCGAVSPVPEIPY